MIRFEQVTYSYGDGAQARAVDEVSFEVHSGEMVAVLGANGSGKSTLSKLANGLLLPGAGRVTVDGMDTRAPGREFEIRSSVAIVFQSPDDQIVATSVEDDVAFGPENLALPRDEIRRRVDAAIAATGLTGLEGREPHLLSGGQKQRLCIAGALAMQPRFVVLDEPTSMIDAEGRTQVRDVIAGIRNAGVGILLVTHDLDEAMSADRVVVLAAGRLVFEGQLHELIARGDDFDGWGIEMSPLAGLATRLVDAGVPMPHGVHEAGAVACAVLEHRWH